MRRSLLMALLALAACKHHPFRQLAFVNTLDVPVTVEIDGREIHVEPHGLGYHPADLGKHTARFVAPSGKSYDLPLDLPTENKRGASVDYTYVDIAGDSDFLLVDASRLYQGKAFMQGAVEAMRQMTGGKLIRKQYDGAEPFRVLLDGNVTYAQPYERLPKETGWAMSVLKLVPVPKKATKEERLQRVLKALQE